MKENDIVDYVAQAMWDSDPHSGDIKWKNLDQTIDAALIEEFRSMAKAAIEAYKRIN